LARQAQAQNDKNHAPAAKVITNDDMPSTSGLSSVGLGDLSNPKSGSKQAAAPSAASPADELIKAESLLTTLESMDRPTLVKLVLQGADHDFPGRAQWEARMFAAKQVYVSHGREVIQKAKQLVAEAQSMQGNVKADDPRSKEIQSNLKDLMQDAVQTAATFKAVTMEGKDLASQSNSH
jgi:hypothetical protein